MFRSQFSFIETTRPPLKTMNTLYSPLGIVVEIGSYGIAEIDGVSAYLYSMSCSSSQSPEEKRVIGLRHLLTTDLAFNTLSTSKQLQYNSDDVFSLPDGVKIDYTHKTPNGFIHKGRIVSYGKATFLSDVLPEVGWFVKVNRRIGRVSTVLLTETSWMMSAKQKAYVDKYLRN